MKYFVIEYFNQFGDYAIYNCVANSENDAIVKFHRYVGYFTIRTIKETK